MCVWGRYMRVGHACTGCVAVNTCIQRLEKDIGYLLSFSTLPPSWSWSPPFPEEIESQAAPAILLPLILPPTQVRGYRHVQPPLVFSYRCRGAEFSTLCLHSKHSALLRNLPRFPGSLTLKPVWGKHPFPDLTQPDCHHSLFKAESCRFFLRQKIKRISFLLLLLCFVFCLLVCLFFQGKVCLRCPGCSRTWSVDQASLELTEETLSRGGKYVALLILLLKLSKVWSMAEHEILELADKASYYKANCNLHCFVLLWITRIYHVIIIVEFFIGLSVPYTM